MGELDCDVAVVGGGLVGLSLAYELAARGSQVTVIDGDLPGRATDAAAGILSPDTTASVEPFWWEMSHGAGAHYPALLERLQADGAATDSSGYAVCGLLSIGLRAHEDAWFAPFAELVTSRPGSPVHEIAPSEAQGLFPPLGVHHRVLHNPEAARVDGRGMAQALRQAAVSRGVTFVTGTASGVTEHTTRGPAAPARTVSSVQVPGQPDVRCGAVAVAGGAWSAAMGEWFSCPLPVAPTKGQIVHLGVGADSGSWPIAQPFLTHYLVPWPDGRVACGGTFEVDSGFSTTVTAAGVQELLRECLSVAPGLADAEYLQTRVGLRPTSADDRPVIGSLPGWSNVSVATGHGANGLLLGPYTARLLADQMTGRSGVDGHPVIWPELSPSRFS